MLLEDGTYKGPGNRDLDFRGKALVLRSRGGPAVCVIDCEGAGRGLRFASGETPAARVEGVGIVNGRAAAVEGAWTPDLEAIAGGAILCRGASPTIAGCVLRLNRAVTGGAVACLAGASPHLVDCLLRQNTAEQGGGLHAHESAPRLEGCFLVLNTAERGGGISAWGASVRVLGCTLDRNSAMGGGGMICEAGAVAELVECLLHGNQATLGGALMADGCSPVLDRCTLVANSAGWGSALNLTAGRPVLKRTIVAAGVRGAAVTGAGEPEVVCSLVVGNCGGDWVGCLEGLLESGGGNRQEAFSFVDARAGDFRLGPGFRDAGCGRPGASQPRLRPPASLWPPPPGP